MRLLRIGLLRLQKALEVSTRSFFHRVLYSKISRYAPYLECKSTFQSTW